MICHSLSVCVHGPLPADRIAFHPMVLLCVYGRAGRICACHRSRPPNARKNCHGSYIYGNYIRWCPRQRSDPQGTGQAPPGGVGPVRLSGMFPDDRAAGGWFTERRWQEVPHCGNRPRPVGSGAHDDALPLPRARMPQAVLRVHRQFGHYRI